MTHVERLKHAIEAMSRAYQSRSQDMYALRRQNAEKDARIAELETHKTRTIQSMREMRSAFVALIDHHKNGHHDGNEPTDEEIAHGWYSGSATLAALYDLPMVAVMRARAETAERERDEARATIERLREHFKILSRWIDHDAPNHTITSIRGYARAALADTTPEPTSAPKEYVVGLDLPADFDGPDDEPTSAATDDQVQVQRLREAVIVAARRLDGWPRRPYPGSEDATSQANAELQDLHESRDALTAALKQLDAATTPPTPDAGQGGD